METSKVITKVFPRFRMGVGILGGLLVAAWLLGGDVIVCWLEASAWPCSIPHSVFAHIYYISASSMAMGIWLLRQMTLSPAGWFRRWEFYIGIMFIIPFAAWPTAYVFAVVCSLLSSSEGITTPLQLVRGFHAAVIVSAKIGIVVTWYRLLMSRIQRFLTDSRVDIA